MPTRLAPNPRHPVHRATPRTPRPMHRGTPCTPLPSQAPPCKPGQHCKGQESGAGAGGASPTPCSQGTPTPGTPRSCGRGRGCRETPVKTQRTVFQLPAAGSARPIQPSNLLAKLDNFIVIFLIDLPAIIESYTICTQPAAQPSTQLLLQYHQVKRCLLVVPDSNL